ncbi:MAG: GNAT family N-acetyltransferase, partial [Myxococcota bacterium]
MGAGSLKRSSAVEGESFCQRYEGFGDVEIRPFDLKSDPEFLYDWVQRDYAYFWGLQGKSRQDVRDEYVRLIARDRYAVFVGFYEQSPAFVMERYDPSFDDLAECYPVQPGDSGIHLIVAPPPSKPVAHFTWYMFRAVLDFVFRESSVSRVVVEPDIRNRKMFT